MTPSIANRVIKVAGVWLSEETVCGEEGGGRERGRRGGEKTGREGDTGEGNKRGEEGSKKRLEEKQVDNEGGMKG